MSSISPPSGSGGAALLNPLLKYLPNASPANTRQSTLVISGEGSAGSATTWADHCQRFGFQLPSTTTQWRLRIRNNNCLANTTVAGAMSLIGVAIGAIKNSDLGWSGAFASAPTTISEIVAATIDPGAIGAEYVSPWVTSANEQFTAFKQYGISIGINAGATPTTANGSPNQLGYGAGTSANFAQTAMPGVSFASYLSLLDIRMEYQFVGSNLIGFCIGDSLSAGVLSGGFGGTPKFGLMGPGNKMHEMAGIKSGIHMINGGVTAFQTSNWITQANLCWSRFDLATNPPDFAVILIGSNDAATGPTGLATYQANIQSIITILNGLGISKVYMLTIPGNRFNGTFLTAQAAAAQTAFTANDNTLSGFIQIGGPNDGTNSELHTVSTGPTGTGPYGYTANSNLTVLHPKGTIVAGLNETARLQYNDWIRQQPPGITAAWDIDSEMALAPYNGMGHPFYFGDNNPLNAHPNTPSGYMRMSDLVAPRLQGI